MSFTYKDITTIGTAKQLSNASSFYVNNGGKQQQVSLSDLEEKIRLDNADEELLIVDFQFEDNPVANKSFEEIEAAILSGKYVVARMVEASLGERVQIPMTLHIPGEVILFSMMFMATNIVIVINSYGIQVQPLPVVEQINFSGAVNAVYDGTSPVDVEIPTVPSSLKNPYPLKLTGGATATYDGSKSIEVNIPVVDQTEFVHFKGSLSAIPQDNTGYLDGDIILVDSHAFILYQDVWYSLGNNEAVQTQQNELGREIAKLEEANDEMKKYVDDSVSAIDLTSYVKTVDGYAPNNSGNVELKAMRYLGYVSKMPTDNSQYVVGDVMEIEGTIYYYNGSAWHEFSQHISADAAHHRIDELGEEVLTNKMYLGIPSDWDHMSTITDEVNELRQVIDDINSNKTCVQFKGYVMGNLPYVEDYSDGDLIVCNNVIYVCCNKVWYAADNAADVRNVVNKTLLPRLEALEKLEHITTSEVQQMIDDKIDPIGNSMVKSVNNIMPDDDGNIEIPSGEVFYVNITENGNKYSFDKTYAEIKAAHDDNLIILAHQQNPSFERLRILYLVSIDDQQGARFQDVDGSNRKDYYTVKVDNTMMHSYLPYRVLTFSGAVTGTYNGTEDVEINIPTVSGSTNVDLSGYVPTSRTINGIPLSNDITLLAHEVGADAKGTAEALLEELNIKNNGGDHSIMTRTALPSNANFTVSLGISSLASGSGGCAIGSNTTAYSDAVAQGTSANANGFYGVAIGDDANASGYSAIALGGSARASGQQAISIGSNAQANEYRSVAIGNDVIANGKSSSAFGTGTIVNGADGVALGRYNEDPSPTGWFYSDGRTYPRHPIRANQIYKVFTSLPTPDLNAGVFVFSEPFVETLGANLSVGSYVYVSDTEYVLLSEVVSTGDDIIYYKALVRLISNYTEERSTYALMYGNGHSNARKNIHTLDWNGNGWFSGNVYVGGTNQSTGATRLATESYVSSNYATKTSVNNLPTKAYVESAISAIKMPTTIQHLRDGEKTGSLYASTADATELPGAWSVALGFNSTAPKDASFAAGYSTSATGYYSTAFGSNTQASGYNSFAVGSSSVASGSDSVAIGYQTTASGMYSSAIGHKTTASNQAASAEGYNSTASGKYAHAEGYFATAEGEASHAEGQSTDAIGECSHASGQGSQAHGACSYAQGVGSSATGTGAHAEGSSSANGNYAHSEGFNTVALGYSQHVEGKMNIEDPDEKYAHIIGNGTYDDRGYEQRSNAHTVDWEGNGWYAGTIEANGIILKASTPGCDYRFLLTVDAYGQLSVAKIEE